MCHILQYVQEGVDYIEYVVGLQNPKQIVLTNDVITSAKTTAGWKDPGTGIHRIRWKAGSFFHRIHQTARQPADRQVRGHRHTGKGP